MTHHNDRTTIAGLPALKALRRELRTPVADRDDGRLERLCIGCGILLLPVSPSVRYAQASACLWEKYTTVNPHGDIDRTRSGIRPSQTLAVSTDRTSRAAIRRLLESAPEAVLRAALSEIVTIPAQVREPGPSVFQVAASNGGIS